MSTKCLNVNVSKRTSVFISEIVHYRSSELMKLQFSYNLAGKALSTTRTVRVEVWVVKV